MIDTSRNDDPVDLRSLVPCFEGAVPATIATQSAAGVPNVTVLSRVRLVDDEHVALSNQFFSKTARNLAEHPRASLLVIDPTTFAEYRLTIAYERTERRGPLFDQLRRDVEAVASTHGMQDVFRLRGADIYRVVALEAVAGASESTEPKLEQRAGDPAALSELCARLTRCPDLDTLVEATVDGLAELLHYHHSYLLLTDERGERLYTIASHGYGAQGVGSEVAVGEGVAGVAAAQAAPIRAGNLRQMAKYGHAVHRRNAEGDGGPGLDIDLPTLPEVQSRVAVPAMALGQLVGVLVVERADAAAFGDGDEAVLSVVASVVGNAVEVGRRQAGEETGRPRRPAAATLGHGATDAVTLVRYFPVDGSIFLDGDYLIKGVAGRLLWALLGHHEREGRDEFTNREVRLDPSLELPEFRQNLESRLILLKRRLDERDAPIRIEKTGRGRFRLLVGSALHLDAVDPA